MKRLFCLLLSLMMLVSLCGCGKALPAPEPGSAPAVESTPKTEPDLTPEAETETAGISEDDIPGIRFSTTDREDNLWNETVFAGHLTMLNFWEPWCGPCVREMPDLQKLSDDYADRGFQIMGIYSTPGMEEDVDAVLESTGIQYPILHYTDAFDAFQSGYVPTTVFVDGNGRVLGEGLYVGSRSYAEWENLIQELLG